MRIKALPDIRQTLCVLSRQRGHRTPCSNTRLTFSQVVLVWSVECPENSPGSTPGAAYTRDKRGGQLSPVESRKAKRQ